VNDGSWHHVALMTDGSARTQALYLDGQLVGSKAGVVALDFGGSFNQIGTGYTGAFWGNTNFGWYGFHGQIADVQIWSQARSPQEIAGDMRSAPSGQEPGLEAYYRFDDGQGTTARDATAHHRDAVLETMGGSLPARLGRAIDLGGDGATPNAV